jgi:hypothetical protein
MFASASDDYTIRIWGFRRQERSSRTADSSTAAIDHFANCGPYELLEDLRVFQPETV